MPTVRSQRFTDAQGRAFTISTDNAAVDLAPFAQILISTFHSDEIAALNAVATDSAKVTSICQDEFAVACYGPTDSRPPPSSGGPPRRGTMVFFYQDPDIRHSLVHEYGHHMDNQLYNLPPELGCNISQDGSRSWFFSRPEAVRSIFVSGKGCDPRARWDELLGELYAEDFAQLSGVDVGDFDLQRSIKAPSVSQLARMRYDIKSQLILGVGFSDKGRFRRSRGSSRSHPLGIRIFPVFIDISLRGRAAKRMVVYVNGKRWASGRRRIISLLPPGKHRLRVYPSRVGGSYRVRIGIF